MNVTTYLFKIGNIFHKFFIRQSQKSNQHSGSYFELERQEKLKKQCQKATQEITYLKSFNHWPIATSKQDISQHTKR